MTKKANDKDRVRFRKQNSRSYNRKAKQRKDALIQSQVGSISKLFNARTKKSPHLSQVDEASGGDMEEINEEPAMNEGVDITNEETSGPSGEDLTPINDSVGHDDVYSGGLNPWGTPSGLRRRNRDLTPPYVDDGLIEVVGFRDAWHGLVLLAKGHGTRLAQANRIQFEFHKGAADHTFMRIDGEPWKQPLSSDDDTVMVEISHLGQVNMLATQGCRSKSVHAPTSTHGGGGGGGHDSDEDDSTYGEEQGKFGAADMFKIPDGVELAHLS